MCAHLTLVIEKYSGDSAVLTSKLFFPVCVYRTSVIGSIAWPILGILHGETQFWSKFGIADIAAGLTFLPA